MNKLYVEHEDCGGSATLAEHHPQCDGYRCVSSCPIPVPCECRCGHVEVDPVSAVRVGVESGTIKGEVEWYCVLWENRQGVSEPCESGSTHDGDAGCHWRLVIPMTVECRVCGGSGQVFRPDVVDYDDVVTPECSNCRGSGVIPVSDGGSET